MSAVEEGHTKYHHKVMSAFPVIDNRNISSSDDSPTTDTASSESATKIEYEFLTFKTNVPTRPVFLPDAEISKIPLLPDLTKYADPFTWSLPRKRLMTTLSCCVNATAAYSAGSYASPAAILERKWHVSYVVYNIGITIFTVGFGVAPMVLAPLSEIGGRRPIFIVTGFLFVVCQLWSALSNSFGSMLAARLFAGIGGSTFSTMGAGILADIWMSEDRNTAMVMFTGATLFGTGLGPLVSGFVAQRLLWRWVFYLQLMIPGLLVVLVFFYFSETRGPILLSQKARALNAWYEEIEAAGAIGVVFQSEVQAAQLTITTTTDIEKHPTETHPHNPSQFSPLQPRRLRYRVQADEERASLLTMISLSLYRPLHLLLTESVVFWFSLWISFSWAVLYLQFGSVPLVFSTVYGFTLEQTGAVFTSICVCAVIMTALSIYQDKWAARRFSGRPIGGRTPEGRLYFTCLQSALMPIGLFWFGWTCYPSIHWIVPTIAVGVATMGIFSIFLAVFNYSADVYRTYASSALAASGLCRNLLGGSFPLVTRQMFNNLGFHAASSLLGGIGLALTLVPWVLVFFGPAIRRRSRIARRFVEEEERERRKEEEKDDEGGG